LATDALHLRQRFEADTETPWENEQGEPDLEYVRWLEELVILSLFQNRNREGKYAHLFESNEAAIFPKELADMIVAVNKMRTGHARPDVFILPQTIQKAPPNSDP